MVTVPGAMDSGLSLLLFGSLAFSLVVAFVLTVSVNRWLIARGRGHAVVHDLHGGTRPTSNTTTLETRAPQGARAALRSSHAPV